MDVRRWVSWCARTNSCTSRGMAPCSRKGAWFAGQRARFLINPTVAYRQEGRIKNWHTTQQNHFLSPEFPLHWSNWYHLKVALHKPFRTHPITAKPPTYQFLQKLEVALFLILWPSTLTIYLYQRPMGWWVQKFNHNWESIVKTNSILGHLCFLVSAGQMTKSTDGRLSDVLPVTSTKDGTHESLYTTHLAHHHLVLIIIASEIRKNSGCTGDDIYIIWAQQLNKGPKKTFHPFL